MRKLFFLAAMALSASAALAQCNELFISEYIEGWSNNKAIEIYNPTGAAIDLSDYRLERYSNGATSAQDNQKVDLSGTIEPGDVVVCVLDKQDPDGVDFEAPVWDELAAVADLWLCPVYEENNAMYFNGNDAMVLRKISTNSAIDIFGVIGEDPGSAGWDEITQNHTLVRRAEVTGGDMAATDAFDVLAVWDSLEVNTFDQLGFHVCDCVTSVEERSTASLQSFPNPFNDQLDLVTGQPMETVVIRDLSGAEVRRIQAGGVLRMRMDLSDLPVGAYLIEARMVDGAVARRQTVKN
jgi:predicted extracellular nuclease